MGKLITLPEYADKHGVSRITVWQRVKRGSYASAQKLGRDWLIDEDEPHIDHRIKSGAYKDWRAKYGKGGGQDAGEEKG